MTSDAAAFCARCNGAIRPASIALQQVNCFEGFDQKANTISKKLRKIVHRTIMSRPMHRRHLDCATLLPVVIITHCSVKRSSSRLFTAPEPSSTVVCYGWKRNNSAKTRLAKTKVMLKTMKQMRSRTAAAIIHSFIIC